MVKTQKTTWNWVTASNNGGKKITKRKSSSADTTPERVWKGKLVLCKLECEAVWHCLSSTGSSWGHWGCSYSILGQWRAQFFSRYIQTALPGLCLFCGAEPFMPLGSGVGLQHPEVLLFRQVHSALSAETLSLLSKWVGSAYCTLMGLSEEMDAE